MSALQAKLAGTHYKNARFAFYEFYFDESDLDLGDVVSTAAISDIAFSTRFLVAGIPAGETWYAWARPMYDNGDTEGQLVALGTVTTEGIDTASIADHAITFPKFQTIGTAKVLGRATAGTGNVEELPLGAANGVATLDSSGLIPVAQLPAIAIIDTFPVSSQAAMLALTAQKGDVAVRSDLSKSFILSTNSPSTLTDWIELKSPTGAVTSVAGKTGAVTLVSVDISDASSAGQALMTAANAGAQRTALALGTSAVLNTGTAGGTVPLCNGGNTWSAGQEIAFSISNNEVFDVQNQSATNPYGMWIDHKNVSGGAGQAFITCSDGNYSAVQARIAGNGNGTNTNGVWGTISDFKTKWRLKRAPSYWDKTKSLGRKMVTYEKRGDDSGERLLSIVTQEAKTISNGIVERTPDMTLTVIKDAAGKRCKVWKPTGTFTETLKTTVLLLMGFKTLAEACERIEQLETNIPVLEKRIAALEKTGVLQ